MSGDLVNPEFELHIDEDKAVTYIKECTLEHVENFEKALIDTGVDQADEINEVNLKEKLCNGLYSRALTIPKGTFITGRLHLKDYIDIFVSGDLTVKSFFADGTIEETKRLNEFTFLEGKAGRKRVLIAHEDSLWITVDPTEATDIEGITERISSFNSTEYKMLKEGEKCQ